jgi:MoaA/NifB/PqqE/SkfB family radical SAM enzyme
MAEGTRAGHVAPVAGSFGLNDHDGYFSIALEFRCNLRCTHCMIEGTMDRLSGASPQDFDAVLERKRRGAPWQGLVLTGSEITLRRDLPNLARRARAAGFAHVRIQTHGAHLHRETYLNRLVEAGVDEFFVSVAGPDAEIHDAITCMPGSFGRMAAGLKLIDAHPAPLRIITNTVVTAQSFLHLPKIAEFLMQFDRVVQAEFWNYFPMAETDVKSLIVPLADLMPPLRQAISVLRRGGRKVEVKNVPECLLEDQRGALVNNQPELLIDPAFWTEFDRNRFYQCPHQASCASDQCLGLTQAYIRRFGDGADLLKPF